MDGNNVIGHTARLDLARPAQHHGRSDRALVHSAEIATVGTCVANMRKFSTIRSVIAGVHHQRIISETELFECVEHLPYPIVVFSECVSKAPLTRFAVEVRMRKRWVMNEGER